MFLYVRDRIPETGTPEGRLANRISHCPKGASSFHISMNTPPSEDDAPMERMRRECRSAKIATPASSVTS
jgi:hypothetical protein